MENIGIDWNIIEKTMKHNKNERQVGIALGFFNAFKLFPMFSRYSIVFPSFQYLERLGDVTKILKLENQCNNWKIFENIGK